jgi:hypothetical protein
MIRIRQNLTSHDEARIILPIQFVVLESFQVESLKRCYQTKKGTFMEFGIEGGLVESSKGITLLKQYKEEDKVIPAKVLELGRECSGHVNVRPIFLS